MNFLRHGAFLTFILTAGSCSPDTNRKAARDDTRILMERVEVLESDAKRAADEARAAERSLQTVREETKRKEKEATAERESLRKQTEEAVKALDDYKAKYRISYRSRAKGQRLARLDCGDGGVFENVEILSLTPGELRYHHANGIATVALGRPETGQREMLGYDPREAAVWLKERESKAESSGEGEAVRSSQSATASLSRTKKPASFATGQRGQLQASLSELYLRGRSLQADRNCCPVHKRYQLAEWAQQAARLKQRLATLPPGG